MAEKLQYKLESFEGPLDLLLFLISKHKLDIFDINISELLGQYLDTLDGAGETEDLEGASEFLEMAARLVYIKTAMLLPRHEEEGEQLKRELQGELIEYQACKRVAGLLRLLDCGGQVFCRPPAEIETDMTYIRIHPTEDIARAYLSALGRKQRKMPPPVSAFKAIVQARFVPVAAKAIVLLKKLYKRGRLELSELFAEGSRSDRVAMFLALLELAKNGRITISEDCETAELNRTGKEDGIVAAGTI